MNQQNEGKKKRAWLILLCAVVGVILAMLIALLIFIQIGKGSLLNRDGMQVIAGSNISDTEVSEDGQTIQYKGETYRYNENMTAILCMGIDRKNVGESEAQAQGEKGQADALFLYAMDTKSGASTIIPIPRDTMVDVDLYSASGKYVSSSEKQICLSFAYGDGKQTSCENTLKSVSRLFYGIPINSYVAIDLSAIEVLTNAVGGVPVTPLADGTYGDYSFEAGKPTVLTGKQAVAFVTKRELKLEGSLERMSRQKLFVKGFFDQVLAKTRQDIQTPIRLYNAAAQYMITDINLAEISFFTTCVLGGGSGGSMQFHSLQGAMVEGADGFAEYRVDEEKVYETVLEVFYQTVK